MFFDANQTDEWRSGQTTENVSSSDNRPSSLDDISDPDNSGTEFKCNPDPAFKFLCSYLTFYKLDLYFPHLDLKSTCILMSP
jgi:hypothetical protein